MAVSVVEEVGLTDVGRQRQSNEDSFYEAPPVFAVADGMGGARAGEVASRMAVEAFGEALDRSEPEARLEDRKSTRLNSSHANISYADFCLKKKNMHFGKFE